MKVKSISIIAFVLALKISVMTPEQIQVLRQIPVPCELATQIATLDEITGSFEFDICLK